jgi:hypothetical protein
MTNSSIKTLSFHIAHRPNVHRVEIEVTTRCNLMCRHCDRRCSQAPAEEDLPVDAVRQFIDESLEIGHRWTKIGLLGGEPTLHPEIRTIIAMLRLYTKTLDDCGLFLVSNAQGNQVQAVLNSIRSDIVVLERPKTASEPWFNNMDLAPIDLCSEVSPCWITHDCGLGLTSRGFYPCGPAAAIARALNLGIGIKSLRAVTDEAMIGLLRQFCQYCGHALAIQAGVNNTVSPFWKAASENYYYVSHKLRANHVSLKKS